MRDCRWPKCTQPTLSDDECCYYHSKVRDGLVDAPQRLRTDTSPSPAAVVSDEQMEIARTLTALGADQDTVKRALTRDSRRGAMGRLASKGTGVRLGRVAER